MAKTDLVIFDCDGVLVDSEMIASRVLARELTDMGYPLEPEDCRARFTGISMDKVVSLIEADWGRRLPGDFQDHMRAKDFEAFETELTAIPGVPEMLDALDRPKCVASSGSPEKIRNSLRITGLTRHFGDRLFSAKQVEHGKPAPDLFLFAAKAMGADPTRCLVVEDAPAGVQGALAAGMRVLGYTGGGHCGPGYADRLRQSGAETVVHDIRRLLDLLDHGDAASSAPR